MSAGIQIGASKDAVVAARNGIMDILATSHDQKTIRKALDVFRDICAVKGVNVSGCTITVAKDPSDAG